METFRDGGRITATLIEYVVKGVMIQEWVDYLSPHQRRGRVNFRVADTNDCGNEVVVRAVIEAWQVRIRGGALASDPTVESAEAFMRQTRGFGVLHAQWPVREV